MWYEFISVSLYSIHCNFASVDSRVVLFQQNTFGEFTSEVFTDGGSHLHSTLQL